MQGQQCVRCRGSVPDVSPEPSRRSAVVLEVQTQLPTDLYVGTKGENPSQHSDGEQEFVADESAHIIGQIGNLQRWRGAVAYDPTIQRFRFAPGPQSCSSRERSQSIKRRGWGKHTAAD